MANTNKRLPSSADGGRSGSLGLFALMFTTVAAVLFYNWKRPTDTASNKTASPPASTSGSAPNTPGATR
jgi:hypothetical protein